MNEAETIIKQGRAFVRLIEAAEVLLTGDLDEAERVLLEHVRQVYKSRLRALVGAQPPAETAQILAVSENINAPVGEFGLN
jgi:hypothetical protein